MAETGSYASGFRLDIKQILLEAQNRWLRPAEICEILRNYQKFHISSEPPHKPTSGSVFLFDRKVLRYFRKDGHNWRKKKDGKTVKEAHEKLKVGSVDMVHCYYAHGEDNENFQRRSYWMLEQDLMHIVFVHYLEIKGNKANIGGMRNLETDISTSENESTSVSAYEDTESEDHLQASSRFHAFPNSPLTDDSHSALSSSYNMLQLPDYAYLPQGRRGGDSDGGSFASGARTTLETWNEVLGHSDTAEITYKQESGSSPSVASNWQQPFEDHSLNLHGSIMNQNLMPDFVHDQGSNLFEDKLYIPNQQNLVEPFYFDPQKQKEQSEQGSLLQMLLSDAETGNLTNPNSENGFATVGSENYSFLQRKPLISGLQKEEGLKKADSFSRWIAKELGEADELHMQSNTGISWSMMGGEDYSTMPVSLQADTDTLNPSLSQDQLFSIIGFSPDWAYSNMETKVLITGIFLKSKQELANCRWSIMFGEVEVPAELLGDGLLCCHAPPHKPGLVPFYITCSNRLACSEVREFEYRSTPDQEAGNKDASEGGTTIAQLRQRFEMMLSLEHVGDPSGFSGNGTKKQNIVDKIFSLMEEDKRQELKLTGEQTLMQLKEKFSLWLLHKVNEDGKGPSVLDEGGQGVLHLAAALGYNWALQPIIVSGVSIDFRDMYGWTALHWAAYYGRENTVVALLSLGAAPGALTDPTAEYKLGRTPADLASAGGHKGISGFLAEIYLTKQLSTLTVNDSQGDGFSDVSGVKAIDAVSEPFALPTTEEDLSGTLSLKDSLAAVCKATQAAARIHQIFRIQSFQRKQLIHDDMLKPDEHAISLMAAKKTSRFGHNYSMANSAATRIQKKFRGYTKRKEFLLIRQKIVKIQAHVRGHQVRKKYKNIVWSVGILEKVILRWRRKGSGLRGFRSDEVVKGPSMQAPVPPEDDYDFLKEGRKQTEERMQKALARVKSMAQYPEARAQYRRLLTAAEGLSEPKQEALDVIPSSHEEMIYSEEDLIDIESLLDDDTFMSMAFQ